MAHLAGGVNDALSWRQEMAGAYTDVAELLAAGLLLPDEALRLRAVERAYQIRVPRYYAALIDRDNLTACPIRAQALPHLGEVDPDLPDWATRWSQAVYGRPIPWTHDPIGDLANLAAPRLTHRYKNRAILHVSAACALYCRFCFRKSHLNEREEKLYRGGLEPALAYLREHPEINEVILTGGDPLSLPDAPLSHLLDSLEGIEHLQHIRLHSRMVVTLPQRLGPALIERLGRSARVVALVSHFNHPRELTPQATRALAQLRRAGVALYNQTVLLRGVNVCATTLEALFCGLYTRGVRPFYLHHPDWTAGTFQFRTPLPQGQRLLAELAGRVPGPAMPSYVVDVPGGAGKVNLMAASCLETRQQDGLWAGLFALRLPHTRASSGGEGLYLDMAPAGSGSRRG